MCGDPWKGQDAFMFYTNSCFTVGLDGMGGSKITRCVALSFPLPLPNKSKVSLLAL